MRKRNPWIGLLWGIGIALVVGGYAANFWLQTFYYPPPGTPSPGPVVVFLQDLADNFVSPSLYVGFGTIAGLLFLHAKSRKRTKKSVDSHG